MADQDNGNSGNGAAGDDAPQVAAIAQYIKDLSVESPSSPQVFQWQEQPQLDVQFHLNVDRVSDEVNEVMMKIEVSARSDKGVHFLVDLTYAGLFGLRNVPEEAFGPFLLVEAPRLLFPFARQIIADATQQTGFPPLLLDPIDFAGAYMAQMEAQQPGAVEDGVADGSNGSGEPDDGEPPAPAQPTQ